MAVTTEPAWLNRTNGVAPANGTTSHTISFGFTPATGSLLVFVVFGGVTHTNTGGWTERAQPVSSAELSLFTKDSTGETSITLTHNGSNYPVAWAAYEFPAGSTYTKVASANATNDTFPALTALPGTEQVILAFFGRNDTFASASAAWGGTWTEDSDTYTASVSGYALLFTTAHQLNVTATSITPTLTPTYGSGGGTNSDREKIVAAFTVAATSSVPSGAGAGTTTWTGSATGSKVMAGVAAGLVAWAGVATGATTDSGSAIGATSWVGSATGSSALSGSAAGSIAWTGAATGARGSSGAASGTAAWVGAATGTTTNSGSGSGSTSWVGAGTGITPGVDQSTGSGAGSVAWVGAATGSRTSQGSATGTTSWVGAGSGSRTSLGSAAGSTAWVGVATGSTPAVGGASGTGAGNTSWTGVATGARTSTGAGVGATDWQGLAAGIVQSSGAGAGTVLWVGSAVGTSADQRDVTVLSVREVSRPFVVTERTRTVTVTEAPRPFTTTGGPMYLKAAAREFYSLAIVTEPAVAAWEASFDGGTTFVAGEVDGANTRWLLAGPDADPGTATVLTVTVYPLLRAVDNPEIVVRDAPRVYVT